MYFKVIEGESVFSLAARHHVVSPYNSLREKNRALFGRPDIKLNPQLPCSLSMISLKMSIPIHYLLNHGTIYPLISATIHHEKDKNALSHAMLSNCGTSVMALSRLVSCRLKLGNTLKYCPECLTQDESQYGCGIWHTNHQLAGVTVCPKHATWLLNISLNADGLNKRIEPPPSQFVGFKPSPEPPPITATKLSLFLSELSSLAQDDSTLALSDPHMTWLDEGHYLTSEKHIRLEKLSREFNHYWSALFKLGVLPNQLSDISYVRNLVKPDRNMHYIKHALLGMLFTDSPKEYYSKPAALDTTPAPIQNNAPSTEDADEVATLLKKELSLRSVAKATGHSMGFLAALAQRNGITVKHRFKQLSNSLVDRILKLAFRGFHRRDIAKSCGVSVATVEQQINSMSGLAAWRKRLWFCQKRNLCRQTLKSIISQKPTITRTEIKRSSSCYMWLFRYDKDWLSQHLPKRVAPTFHPSIDWDQVDRKLAKQIRQQVKSARSISHVERQVDSQHSLMKNRKRLPLSIRQAEKIVKKSKNKEQ
ncbi:TPA: TnsD family Tn7-like transposition protein [Vibrio parahaemolyticus]|nr:hypothetical protein [Vibrio parahaemolyticus]